MLSLGEQSLWHDGRAGESAVFVTVCVVVFVSVSVCTVGAGQWCAAHVVSVVVHGSVFVSSVNV